MEELYKRIKQRRIELKMSQQQLADKVGYKGRDTICRIEAGTVDISRSKIEQFAAALDCDPVWLMGYDEERLSALRQNAIETVKIMSEEQLLAFVQLFGK